MMPECENSAGWMMRIASPDSVRNPRFAVSSEIPKHVSFASCAGEKNGLWGLRESPANLLRPQDPPRARSLLWRYPGVPGGRDPARVLPELRHREAREVELVGRQPVLHQAFRLVGRRCRAATIQDVAHELRLDWKTVKALEIEYMREQLRRAGTPAPSVIGIDEIAIGRGHSYRIIVSHLLRSRPIWFGGKDRSEASLDEFFAWLGPKKCRKIRLAVMDMWKAFRKSTLKEGHAPQARIIYDKFHVLKHLGAAMDEVRKQEYARLSGKERRFIKGQKYNLLSRWENLTIGGKQALKLLFGANRRLNKAYLLKESFGQLWDYNRPGWARRFFNNWADALKWQRLEPFPKFAAMVEAHWDGIEAYCHEENKVPLGYVEGFNNKIRVIQRRAYGLRDEEYLRLKILTCTLPEI